MIETERLILREMTEDDFDALYRVLGDRDIMQHYPYAFDEARVRGWINRNIDRYRIFGFGLWAVCLKDTGEMIGDCGLTMQIINGDIRPEIGYHIRRDMQRKGYAKEAAIAVRDWTFRNTPFKLICSYMKYTNIPSAKTAAAYGCRFAGEFEDEVNERTKVFEITKDEWKMIQNSTGCEHPFYEYKDSALAAKMESVCFLSEHIRTIEYNAGTVCQTTVYAPDDAFRFLHESAIIAHKGVLYVSWYLCPEKELQGFTPIAGKRSRDGGNTWSDLEILCEDRSEKILYCPPVYGICEGNLYMLVNQMVAPDHIHSLDLYILNEETDRFELLWSRPVPFKLNTNVVSLPNGKLMLPGRVAELDGFPNTPAVLISDSGRIDAEWRLVRIADNGNLPDGSELVHPEISVMCAGDTLYMFCRNDKRKVPLVYISKDFGETWSDVHTHDIPYVSSKIYTGELSDGRHYLICNTDKFDRTRLTVFFSSDERPEFTEKLELFDTDEELWGAMHYPAAWEYDGYLWVIATKGYADGSRGAELFRIKLL